MMGSIDKLLIDIVCINTITAILGPQYDEIIIQSTTRGDNYYSTCETSTANVSGKMLYNNLRNY